MPKRMVEGDQLAKSSYQWATDYLWQYHSLLLERVGTPLANEAARFMATYGATLPPL